MKSQVNRFVSWISLGWAVLGATGGWAQPGQAAYDSAASHLARLHYHTAAVWAKKALGLVNQPVSEVDTSYAKLLDVIVETDNYLGHYEEALHYGQQALNRWERTCGRRHLRYAYALQNLAEAYQYRLQYPKADSLHQAALQLTVELTGDRSGAYAGALSRLTTYYYERGMTPKAISYAQQTVAAFEQLPDRPAIPYAVALKNLGELYSIRTVTEPGKAIPLLQQARALLLANDASQTIVYAQLLRSLAVAYYAKKSYSGRPTPDLIPLLRESLMILEATIGRKTQGYINCADALGTFYCLDQQFGLAKEIVEQNLALADSLFGTSHPDYTNFLFSVARVNGHLGLDWAAEPLVVAVNQRLIHELRLFSPTLNDEEREQLFRNVANGFVWLHTYARAFAVHNPAITVEQYNTQLAVKGFLLRADQKFRRQLMATADTSLRRLYANWYNSRERLARQVRLPRAERRQQLGRPDSLETQANALEKQLALRLGTTTSGALQSGGHTWREVQARLKPGEAAVELIRYPIYQIRQGFGPTRIIHYAALIVTPDCPYPNIVYLENGNDLEGPQLQAYRADMFNQTNAASSYQYYWKPISDALRGVRRVYLSPDGVYCQININTLRNPETGRYVLDEREIVPVTTTGELTEFSPVKRTGKPTALLFGYPDYGPIARRLRSERVATTRQPARTRLSRDGFYEPLPATRQEVSDIGQLLRATFAVSTYMQTDAREEVIKKARSPAVLHIATHGFFETDTALGQTLQSPLFRSGLVLAGANRVLQAEARTDLFGQPQQDDGILTAYEAMNLNLGQTDLVVMSACQTGLGEVRNGEGVYGLQRAFNVAGAKSLLMSLWKVDDHVTRQLMTAFYRNWLGILGKTGDKVRAFRLAQQSIRKRYPHPFYWGAFVLVGH